MAPAYKLTYFDVPALGEPIRWLFSYGGIDFEDKRINQEQWPALKPNTPFGQVPTLEHNGKIVSQSTAISRYAAKLVSLTGKNDWENLEIDAIVDTFNDLKQKIIQCHFNADETEKAKLKETLLKETIPFNMTRFDTIVKNNNGYFVGGHLTWADIYVISQVGFLNKFIETDLFAKSPNLQKLYKTVVAHKNLQGYLKKHPLS